MSRKRKQPEPPAGQPATLELPPPDTEIVTPPPPSDDRHRPSQDRDGTEHPLDNHASRVRPDGPRQRHVNEPGSIFTGPNIRLAMDADYFLLDVKRPLTHESRDGVEMYLTERQQNKLIALGMDDVSPEGDASAWMGPKTQAAKAGIMALAVELDGKGERLAAGRGR